jgi:RimJ/RimL family protein N-acetyltransferase
LLGQGLGRETSALVLAYAFETRPAPVDLRVMAFNERAIRSYQASGFQQESIERAAVEIDGEMHDEVIVAITHDRWRDRDSPKG